MSIRFIHQPENNFLIIKITGTLEWEQLQLAAEKLTNSNEFKPDIDTLYDLTEMDFSNITSEFEQQLIQFRKQLNRGNAKIACVVTTEVAFGLGRMYEALSDKLPQQVRVFKAFDDAKLWLTSK